MTSMCTAQLLADLGVTRSLSRPQVSDDNPFSEAQFKTLKYHLGIPGRFDDIAATTAFCRSFFPWYNTEHRHAGNAMLTPHDVHYGRAPRVLEQRERTPPRADLVEQTLRRQLRERLEARVDDPLVGLQLMGHRCALQRASQYCWPRSQREQMSTWRRHRAHTNTRASSIAPPGEEGWTIRDHRAILPSEPYASADLGAASDADRQVFTVRGCAGLFAGRDLTPTAERRHRRRSR